MTKHFGVVAREVQIEVKKNIINSKHDMRRDRYSRGRFVGRGRSLIPQIHSLHHDFENPHHLLKLEFHLEVDKDFLKSQD